jgi:hypothetical protein
MKKIIEVDSKTEGLEKLLGENVVIFCINYIYHGKLSGINDDYIVLDNPSIIYETGAFSEKEWDDIQSLNQKEWMIQKSAIESFGKSMKG